MTVTEIAAAAGVSTQAVRGYCRRHFNASRKGKVWTLSGDDLAEILEHYEIEMPETDSETTPQPGETDGYITMPKEVYEDLRQELRVKNAQIEALNAALARAQESGQAAQLLHAADRKDDLVIEHAEQDQQQPTSPDVATEPDKMTRWEHFKAAFGF
ncbi:MAG: helix-turn-helix domain-containing protein [Eggerthellaceae bacterium]|nr:helix-turn-helix domain-containing protein [Eggerthellaceae bacterium]